MQAYIFNVKLHKLRARQFNSKKGVVVAVMVMVPGVCCFVAFLL